MTAYKYIHAKQTQWALNHGIPLVGSKGPKGLPAYTLELDQNLFEPLAPGVRECFLKGDGSEIKGSAESPAKMQAVHSSSALSVNVFHYWQTVNQVSAIAAACGFCNAGSEMSQSIVFEDKYPVDTKFPFAPNIDVVFYNEDSSTFKRFAVECKFTEPYGSQPHGGLKPAYVTLETVWYDIPALHELARSICPDDTKFRYLHAAQLIKHILGLKTKTGKSGFRLLYLWYDVFGNEGAIHRDEIERFAMVTTADKVKFHALSYQDLILRLSSNFRQEHGRYIQYLTERYL